MTSKEFTNLPIDRCEKHGFVAQITREQIGLNSIFHYVVQCSCCPEIVHWGDEPALSEARNRIKEFWADFEQQPKAA